MKGTFGQEENMKPLYKIFTVSAIAAMLFSAACTKVNGYTPTPSPTGTKPPATTTYTPSPSPTKTPFPNLEGRLFFDMNGSGLPDEASFDDDQARLNSPLNQLERDYLSANPGTFYQPEQIVGLQKVIDNYISENPDTLKDQSHPILQQAIDDYVKAHPDIQDGDLITMDEPALPGYTVCVQDNCVQTDEEGKFSIPNPSGVSQASIKITDPYADFPAWAMRYINNWKGPVTVPAYTKDVDAATMATLTIIPGCDVDPAGLVCKLNGTTLHVRDQHLNDTSIIPIGKGTSIKSGEDKNVGLMQGFLTLPFVKEQVPKPFIMNYFDIAGYYFSDDAGTIAWDNSRCRDGVRLAYDGIERRDTKDDWRRVAAGEFLSGVGDCHGGIDYLVPIGTYIVSGLPTTSVLLLTSQTEPEVRTLDWFEDPANPGEYYQSGGNHLSVQLVVLDQTIYRGQITGLSGDSGNYPPGPRPQQDHFELVNRVPGGWEYRDPYRTIITLVPLPTNYWGSDVSYWTSDNTPQFSR